MPTAAVVASGILKAKSFSPLPQGEPRAEPQRYPMVAVTSGSLGPRSHGCARRARLPHDRFPPAVPLPTSPSSARTSITPPASRSAHRSRLKASPSATSATSASSPSATPIPSRLPWRSAPSIYTPSTLTRPPPSPRPAFSETATSISALRKPPAPSLKKFRTPLRRRTKHRRRHPQQRRLPR